jgi:hypothetical protein
MNLGRDQAEKLKRYFINAEPFLWGVLEARNKKNRLKEIKALGFLSAYSEGGNPTYNKINQDLLIELGIDGILERIIVPQVRKRFDPEILHSLRRYWEQGCIPDRKYLEEKKLYQRRRIVWREEREDKRQLIPKDRAHIFLQIHTQFDYVERWTVFAGLWFEEIEPALAQEEPAG